MRLAWVPLCALLVFGSSPCEGGASQDGPVLALHVQPPNLPKAQIRVAGPADQALWGCGVGSPFSIGTACSSFGTTWPILRSAFVWIMVARGGTEGVGGVSLGIEFDGDAVPFGWTFCADESFPEGSWPVSGSGNRILWDTESNCQVTELAPDGVHAMAGAIYVYAYGDGTVGVIDHPTAVPAAPTVADCAGGEVTVSPGARVAFGTGTGLNPCLAPTPTRPTTWGRLKHSLPGSDPDRP